MASITDFGKAVRKARIDANTTLAQMAETMGTSAAFLSAMETGRKKIPNEWAKRISAYFSQRNITIDNLEVLADVANKTVSLDGMSPAQQMAIAGFARTNFDDAQIESFKRLLGIKA